MYNSQAQSAAHDDMGEEYHVSAVHTGALCSDHLDRMKNVYFITGRLPEGVVPPASPRKLKKKSKNAIKDDTVEYLNSLMPGSSGSCPLCQCPACQRRMDRIMEEALANPLPGHTPIAAAVPPVADDSPQSMYAAPPKPPNGPAAGGAPRGNPRNSDSDKRHRAQAMDYAKRRKGDKGKPVNRKPTPPPDAEEELQNVVDELARKHAELERTREQKQQDKEREADAEIEDLQNQFRDKQNKIAQLLNRRPDNSSGYGQRPTGTTPVSMVPRPPSTNARTPPTGSTSTRPSSGKAPTHTRPSPLPKAPTPQSFQPTHASLAPSLFGPGETGKTPRNMAAGAGTDDPMDYGDHPLVNSVDEDLHERVAQLAKEWESPYNSKPTSKEGRSSNGAPRNGGSSSKPSNNNNSKTGNPKNNADGSLPLQHREAADRRRIAANEDSQRDALANLERVEWDRLWDDAIRATNDPAGQKYGDGNAKRIKNWWRNHEYQPHRTTKRGQKDKGVGPYDYNDNDRMDNNLTQDIAWMKHGEHDDPYAVHGSSVGVQTDDEEYELPHHAHQRKGYKGYQSDSSDEEQLDGHGRRRKIYPSAIIDPNADTSMHGHGRPGRPDDDEYYLYGKPYAKRPGGKKYDDDSLYGRKKPGSSNSQQWKSPTNDYLVGYPPQHRDKGVGASPYDVDESMNPHGRKRKPNSRDKNGYRSEDDAMNPHAKKYGQPGSHGNDNDSESEMNPHFRNYGKPGLEEDPSYDRNMPQKWRSPLDRGPKRTSSNKPPMVHTRSTQYTPTNDDDDHSNTGGSTAASANRQPTGAGTSSTSKGANPYQLNGPGYEPFYKPLCYDETYRDPDARKPGDEGFVPPAVGTRGGYAGREPLITPTALPAGCYDENYVDKNGRKAGDSGFIPPLNGVDDPYRARMKGHGLPLGFDEDYRDANGKRPGEPGFIPPCYTDDFSDRNGRRVTDQGFIPPPHGLKGAYGATKTPVTVPLDAGCYDDNYRDRYGRKPGDRGFVPPLWAHSGATPEQMAEAIPQGYDDYYRDPNNRSPGDHGFIAPRATGALTQGLRARSNARAPRGTSRDSAKPSFTFGPAYRDATGKSPGEEGFISPAAIPPGYKDMNGRSSGEVGFIPPGFHDAQGRTPGQQGFIPPIVLGPEYRDHKGRAPGQVGFVPPVQIPPDYKDMNGRRVGEPGFIPPGFRDANGRTPGEFGFIPPGEETHIGAHGYDPRMGNKSGRKGSSDTDSESSMYGHGRKHKKNSKPKGSDDEDDELNGRKRPRNTFGPDYRDKNGKAPGDAGFEPPIDIPSDYRDPWGKKVGEAGFTPPGYRDAEGRAPGDIGFVRPGPKIETHSTQTSPHPDELAAEKAALLAEQEANAHAAAPSVPQGYTDTYLDAHRRRPGEDGFIPPALGTRADETGNALIQPTPMDDGTYDENYIDAHGRKPGDSGFMPPVEGIDDPVKRRIKSRGLPVGYDAEYRDAHGRAPGEFGFVPPCYYDEYLDPHSRHVTENGFVGPAHGTKGTLGGTKPPTSTPLQAGCYDDNYRDRNGRKPGDIGFLPPLAAKVGITPDQTAKQHPDGYDPYYRDRDGNAPGDPNFQPPQPTGTAGRSVGITPHPQGDTITTFGPGYRDSAGRVAGDEGFVSPVPVPPEYRDYNGKTPGEESYIPFGYRTAHGKCCGDVGFTPPTGTPKKPPTPPPVVTQVVYAQPPPPPAPVSAAPPVVQERREEQHSAPPPPPPKVRAPRCVAKPSHSNDTSGYFFYTAPKFNKRAQMPRGLAQCGANCSHTPLANKHSKVAAQRTCHNSATCGYKEPVVVMQHAKTSIDRPPLAELAQAAAPHKEPERIETSMGTAIVQQAAGRRKKKEEPPPPEEVKVEKRVRDRKDQKTPEQEKADDILMKQLLRKHGFNPEDIKIRHTRRDKMQDDDSCHGCKKPFKDEEDGITALDKDWHEDCFTCATCKKPATGDFITLVDEPDTPYHVTCIPKSKNRVKEDKANLQKNKGIAAASGQPNTKVSTSKKVQLCDDDNCFKCKKAFKNEDDGISALNEDWHEECFTCKFCEKPCIGDFVTLEDKPMEPFHLACVPKTIEKKNAELQAHNDAKALSAKAGQPVQVHTTAKTKHDVDDDKCFKCDKPFKDEDDGIGALDKDWHEECFTCTKCGKSCVGEFITIEGKPLEPYHRDCVPLTKEAEEREKRYEGIEKDVLDKTGQKVKPDTARKYNMWDSDKCYKCDKAFKTSEEGVTALNHDWHDECFQCAQCKKSCVGDFVTIVGQEDVPYHIDCIPKSLSRRGSRSSSGGGHTCPACKEVIHGKKVVALDQRWHPKCFVCTRCKESFTENEGYVTTEDNTPYHEKCLNALEEEEKEAAKKKQEESKSDADHPPCAGCTKPTVGKRITAMNKKWHPECFVCQHCRKPFNAEKGFVEQDDKPFHDECLDAIDEAKRKAEEEKAKKEAEANAPPCGGCSKPTVGKRITAMNKKWHPECFVCQHCRKPFDAEKGFVEDNDKPYHDECLDELEKKAAKEKAEQEADAAAKNAPPCGGCGKPTVGKRITAMNKKWHPECFVCTHCSKPFDAEKGFVEDNDKPYHDECLDEIVKIQEQKERRASSKEAPPCAGCGKPTTGKRMAAMNKKWHPDCFVCQHCKKPFDAEKGFVEQDDLPWHDDCLDKLEKEKAEAEAKAAKDSKEKNAPPCAGCGKPTVGKRITAMNAKWHPECFVCQKCKKPFDAEKGFVEDDGKPYHDECLEG